jgi:hypothetical protein
MLLIETIHFVGVEAVWPHMLAPVRFAGALVGVSEWRFRKQLG